MTIELPKNLELAHAAAQARADDLGVPVKMRVDLTANGRNLGTQTVWVYPRASWNQWRIVDGAPVFTEPPSPTG
jgi:hypothetical protein